MDPDSKMSSAQVISVICRVRCSSCLDLSGAVRLGWVGVLSRFVFLVWSGFACVWASVACDRVLVELARLSSSLGSACRFV